MKKIINILILLITLQSFGQNSKFEIYVDTVNVNIKYDFYSGLKFKNKYYCFFERDNLYFSSLSNKYFYILNKNGIIEHELKIPDDILKNSNYSYFIRNDSIILKSYWEHNCYFLDTLKNEWIKIAELDNLYYQDEEYYVTYLDFGEWGGTLWFKNKKSNIEYETSSDYPIINKLNEIYYVTNGRKIFEIADPTLMKVSDTSNLYEIVEKEKFHEGSNSILGTKVIYKDTTNYFLSKFYFASSFVLGNKLYHLCVNNDTTFIASLDNGSLKTEKIIGNDFTVYGLKILKDKSQILTIRTKNEKIAGFLEIKDNKILIHYLINNYIKQDFGKEKSEKYFNELFDYITININNLQLLKIDEIEELNGANNVTQDHFISTSYYPNKLNYKLETPRIYYNVEDTLFTNVRDYYYTANDSLIKAIMFEWDETRNNSLFSFNENTKEKAKLFQTKYNYIENYVNIKFGKPQKIKNSKNKTDYLLWKTENGLVIELYDSKFKEYRQIRMIIYNE